MKGFKRFMSILMIAAVIASVAVIGTVSSSASGTGIGLAEWAFKAYNEGWRYSWGGASAGAVDCSGLIWSYCGGNRTSMLSDAQANGRDWGYVSNGVPNIHGLGLSRPGHVGVYVGNGMEIDARGTGYNMCYQAVGGSWSCWFKLTAVSYPTSGWQKFNGDYYYYENGEYLANTSRTIDGITYYFASSGISSSTPSDSSSSSSSGSSGSDSSTSSAPSTQKADDNGPLRNGSRGARVEKMQKRLQELGYYHGAIDGVFGDQTEAAFKLFQAQAGLYVDGIAGSDLDILYSDSAPRYVAPTEADEPEENDEPEELASEEDESESLGARDADETDAQEDAEDASPAEDTEEAADELYFSIGDYDDEIVPIQERLITLGYLDGDADGGFGTMTESAVKSFQNVNKLEATGAVDQATYDALFSESAVKNPVVGAAAAVQPTEAKAAASAGAPTTTVERDNAAISSKAVANITDSVSVNKNKVSTNLEFILWLGIMIAVMLIAFTVVYAVEKKKQKAYTGTRYQ